MTVASDDTRWLASVGAMLRDTRLERGVSLEEVAQATKISKSQLAAIESGDASRLPAPVYVRGFVRVYADYLGVSTGPLRPEPVTPPVSHAQTRGDGTASAQRERSRVKKRWVTPLVLGICVLLLAYAYQRHGQSVPPPKAPVAAAPAPQPVAPAFTASSTARPNDPGVPVKPAEVVAQEVTANEGGAVLKLKVNQDCWLNITIDGAISQQYDLKAGDLIEWKAEDSIALDLGNAGGVEAVFNGKQLAPFGEQGKVAHIVLKAESAKDVTDTNH